MMMEDVLSLASKQCVTTEKWVKTQTNYSFFACSREEWGGPKIANKAYL
jgi:hypothetical protein